MKSIQEETEKMAENTSEAVQKEAVDTNTKLMNADTDVTQSQAEEVANQNMMVKEMPNTDELAAVNAPTQEDFSNAMEEIPAQATQNAPDQSELEKVIENVTKIVESQNDMVKDTVANVTSVQKTEVKMPSVDQSQALASMPNTDEVTTGLATLAMTDKAHDKDIPELAGTVEEFKDCGNDVE